MDCVYKCQFLGLLLEPLQRLQIQPSTRDQTSVNPSWKQRKASIESPSNRQNPEPKTPAFGKEQLPKKRAKNFC